MFDKAKSNLSFFHQKNNVPQPIKQKADKCFEELDRLTNNLLKYKSTIYEFKDRANELEELKNTTGKFSRRDSKELLALYESIDKINRALVDSKYLEQIETVNDIFNNIIAPYINKPAAPSPSVSLAG